MSAILAAVCVGLYGTTAILFALAGRPLLALLWTVGAVVWIFTASMEARS